MCKERRIDEVRHAKFWFNYCQCDAHLYLSITFFSHCLLFFATSFRNFNATIASSGMRTLSESLYLFVSTNNLTPQTNKHTSSLFLFASIKIWMHLLKPSIFELVIPFKFESGKCFTQYKFKQILKLCIQMLGAPISSWSHHYEMRVWFCRNLTQTSPDGEQRCKRISCFCCGHKDFCMQDMSTVPPPQSTTINLVLMTQK